VCVLLASPVCLSVFISVCVCLYVFVCLSVTYTYLCMSFFPSAYVCLSVFESICLYLLVCMLSVYISLSLSLSVCPNVYIPHFSFLLSSSSYLFANMPASLSDQTSFHMYLSVHLSVYVSFRLSVCFPASSSVCPFVFILFLCPLSFSLPFLSVCLCVLPYCLCFSLFIFVHLPPPCHQHAITCHLGPSNIKLITSAIYKCL